MKTKFRVWNEKTESFINYGDLMLDLKNGKVYSGDVGIPEYTIDVTNQVILMQSTGLKDKNGVEIFEGDILKHIDFESNECAVNVVYMKHGSLVFDVKIDGGVYTVPVYSIHPEASRGYEDILEVIGNIYENPELLEVAE